MQTEIIKKVVHRITIKPDGFEIHFHVGKAYYSREPDKTGSRLLSFENGNKKPSGHSKPARGSQISDFFKDRGSSLLTNGEPSFPLTELLQAIDFRPFLVKTKNRISAADAQSIADKYKNGCSLKDIADVFSCSKNKIRSELKRHGLELRDGRAQATHKRSLKSGKQAALPYYGFCYLEGRIVKDPREFPVLQKIHRLWSQKKTIHQINLELNQAKILSRTGKTWSWAAIQNVVTRFENKQIILSKGGKYEFR